MPCREQGLDIDGTEVRRAERELPGVDQGGPESLRHLGRVHIVEELRQDARRQPKCGRKRGMFALTVVTTIEGGDIRGQQLPFPSREGRVPPHDGFVELRERNANRRFAGEGALHVRVRHGGKKGHSASPLEGTTRADGWACVQGRPWRRRGSYHIQGTGTTAPARWWMSGEVEDERMPQSRGPLPRPTTAGARGIYRVQCGAPGARQEERCALPHGRSHGESPRWNLESHAQTRFRPSAGGPMPRSPCWRDCNWTSSRLYKADP